ncbi:MAG: molecular chaperone HtpG [Chitinophagales bacterium]
MQTGTISVQTENIFPIIKKYLYSDQEIFLRELVSNAVDATQKLKTLSRLGEAAGELGDLTIEVKVDADAKTLTISDKGIGMTQEEVEKYITQIAFSSAKEFAEKFQGKDADAIIGHFGLGFFSAFMVANKVEIHTLSYKDGSEGVHWTSDGTTEYTIDTSDKANRGTDIILHIEEEAAEYLREARIEELLNKYCRFLPVDIQFGTRTEYVPVEKDEAAAIEDAEVVEEDVEATANEDATTDTDNAEVEAEEPETKEIQVPKIINDTHPIWKKKPADLTDEDYKNFYRALYPMGEEPLFWIHLNVDYPFNLTGVLFFPKIKANFEVRKDRIHLYSNQVFVTDHVEEIVPDFLMLLHGVIDSPDIPLNVSRSYLQSDPEVKKINKYITRKVGDKLDEMFRNERANFEEKWESIGVLVKYGMVTDEKFYDKAKNFCLLTNTEGKLTTFDEYQEQVKPLQTDKNNKIIVLYTNDKENQHSYIEAAKGEGYDVLEFDKLLDPHFIGNLESKLTDVQFKRVDADPLHKLVEKEGENVSVLTEDQEKSLTDLFKTQIGDDKVMVQVEPLSSSESPVVITRPEFMRRMKDMSNLGGANMYGDLPEFFNVIVNANHPVVAKILADEGDKQAEAAKQLYDLALLQQGMLKGAALTDFVNRSVGLMG